MRRVAILLGWVCAAMAQTPQVRPETLLSKIADQARENLRRLPNYTCVETVERTRQIVGGGPTVEDTLRLEVALVDHREMFAWPGSAEFEDTELHDLVTTGTFGNGNFGIYLEMLFTGTAARFEYQGETEFRDRPVRQWTFRVPRALSGYRLRRENIQGVSGFHGSLLADRETFDILRLEVEAEDIPAELQITATNDRIDYGRVTIGEEEFLLPVASQLMMATADSVNRNRVRFASCRKFTGESELVFLDPEMVEAEARAQTVEEVVLPQGTRLDIVIATDADLRTTAVGDVVEGKLSRDVKLEKLVAVPKNAKAVGRVVRLERHDTLYIVDIRWSELAWKGGRARIDTDFDQLAPMLMPQTARVPMIEITGLGGGFVLPRNSRQNLRDLLGYWHVR